METEDHARIEDLLEEIKDRLRDIELLIEYDPKSDTAEAIRSILTSTPSGMNDIDLTKIAEVPSVRIIRRTLQEMRARGEVVQIKGRSGKLDIWKLVK